VILSELRISVPGPVPDRKLKPVGLGSMTVAETSLALLLLKTIVKVTISPA
jgi:hypothetical protein